MVMSRQALRAYLSRDLDSFDWMKRLTRQQILAELNQFRVKPTFKTTPWTHQLVCFYIGLCQPEFLFLLDMGLGKSKILSDLAQHYKRERRLRRALILVPNVINMESWRDDLIKHSDLEPWPCAIENIAEKWDRLSDPEGDITVIDYQGLMLALCTKKGKKLKPDPDRIRKVQRLYNFVGIDESHKLRNHQNLWFEVVSAVTAKADFVYASTGTVFGANPEAMWSQFYLVDKGETFGENLGLFRESFFGQHQDHFGGTVWTFNKRTSPELHQMMKHRSIRYDEDEVPEIELPKRMPPIVRKLDMGDEQRDHYLRALEGLINAEGDPEETGSKWLLMRRIVAGYLLWEDDGQKRLVRFKHNPKLMELERIIREMGDSKLVVCHYYTETGSMLVDHIKEMGIGVDWLYGGTKDKAALRRSFMTNDKVRVLVMNTDAGGTGNDGLQNVARYMVFYETPTPPDVRLQVEKRIHRPGQKHRTFFYDLVLRRTLDQGILDSLAEGKDLFDMVVNGRKVTRRLLEA